MRSDSFGCPALRGGSLVDHAVVPIVTPLDETILAQASALGSAARGVIRLSGPLSSQSLGELFEPAFGDGSGSRIVSGLFFPWNRQRPVPATIFYWPEGHGYTGEESLEIHTVGSPPILEAIIAAILRNENIRLARPGEFTMRAFLSGRIDLTQSEAVLGIVEATNDAALDVALDQLAGGLANPIRKLREAILDTLVRLEAGFDFVEEDIQFVSGTELRLFLQSASDHVESIRRKMAARRLNGAKPRIVLFGPPNAGKTTLFNQLLGSDHGIVSSTPGTTRDYLEVDGEIDGIPCVLVDTAGIKTQPLHDIDAVAQELSAAAATEADIILYCLEAEPSESERRAIETDSQRILLVRTKGTTTLDEIHREIAARLRNSFFPCEVVASTAVRCRECLERVGHALENVRKLPDANIDEALVASEIRVALNALDEIVGEVYTDDLLDRIFSRFCIGK